MNDYQKQLVQLSFRHIVPIADQFANLFYRRLFELNPSLRSLFKGDIEQQGLKLMMTLQIAVSGLQDLERIAPALQRLGREHTDYGVQPSHYTIVYDALIWALEQELGAAFSTETKQAWTLLYNRLADIMQQATPTQQEQDLT